jgi:hypothetical protein
LDSNRLHPWLSPRAASDKGLLGTFERFLVTLSLWWILPITLILFELSGLRIGRGWGNFVCAAAGALAGTFLSFSLWARWDPAGVKGRYSLLFMVVGMRPENPRNLR